MQQCIMKSQSWKFMDNTKTQELKYFDNGTLIHLQIMEMYIKSYFIARKGFTAGVTFNTCFGEICAPMI